MSHKPGIRNFPLAMTTCACLGTRIFPLLPTSVMRFPFISTVMSGRAGPPVVSITVTWVIASVIDFVRAVSVATRGHSSKGRSSSPNMLFT